MDSWKLCRSRVVSYYVTDHSCPARVEELLGTRRVVSLSPLESGVQQNWFKLLSKVLRNVFKVHSLSYARPT